MVNSTSESLWFHDYNNFYLFKKDCFFLSLFFFFIKKKIKVSFAYGIKSENALERMIFMDEFFRAIHIYIVICKYLE